MSAISSEDAKEILDELAKRSATCRAGYKISWSPASADGPLTAKSRGLKICRVQRIPEIGPIVIDDEHMIAVGIESTSSWTPGGDIGIVVKPAPDQSTEVKT